MKKVLEKSGTLTVFDETNHRTISDDLERLKHCFAMLAKCAKMAQHAAPKQVSGAAKNIRAPEMFRGLRNL
jgi:hypothetical protein